MPKKANDSRGKSERTTRDEQRLLTREKLIRTGRKHFLKFGYANTVLEKVSEDAGFSRGPLYANFAGKAELFLAVFDRDFQMHVDEYHKILDADIPGHGRVDGFREAFVRHSTDQGWGTLRVELELAAFHNEKLKAKFQQVYRRDLQSAARIAQRAVKLGDLVLTIPVMDFVLAAQSFMMGLALKHRLLPRELSDGRVKAIAEAFFDCFIASRMTAARNDRQATQRKSRASGPASSRKRS